MRELSGYEFYRLIQVPAEAVDAADGSRGRQDEPDAVVAALAGSHSELLDSGEPAPGILTAWVRSPGDRSLKILVGGRPSFPPADPSTISGEPDGVHSVLFPPGAVAREAPWDDVDTELSRFPSWVTCSIRSDTLWASPPEGGAATVRRGGFDRYAAHLPSPFAWLVIAEPVSTHALAPVLDRLVSEILPLNRGEVGQARRVELERKQARHRELSRTQIGGVWRVRVLAGAADPSAARATAAMLCAATELNGLPYALESSGRVSSLEDALLEEAGEDPAGELAGPELVVALTRPPDRELPGIRIVESRTFDLNQEPPSGAHNAQAEVRLGDVLDDAGMRVGEVRLRSDVLNRHTFVCGATGAGKSQTVRHLLTEATRAGVPWLVIEPAKAEYSRMSARVAELDSDVVVIRLGDPDAPPAGFNPLQPAPGFPLQTHVDVLRALFLAAFESHEPFPQILSTALVRSYEELGWDLALGKPIRSGTDPRYPTLADLQRVAALVVAGIGYGNEVAADVGGFIKVRLSSLRLGTTGRFFEGGHPLSFDRLRERNVVFEIEDVGDDSDKAFLMGAVLMTLSEMLRVRERTTRSQGLSHLTVIEEAHRLLRRPEGGADGASAKAVEMFASLLAEVRAYGEGLIIVEQIPSKLIPDVIKNTAVKVVHRLPAQDDRETVGATMNLGRAQSRAIVSLTPGEGAVFTDGMDRPVMVRIPDGTEIEKGELHPAAIGDLIGRRSTTCGAECVAEACTLRQMREAQHVLADHPWMPLLAELTVVAHLTGLPTPTIDRYFPDVMAARVSRRNLDCALSRAIDDAVAVRSSLLQPGASTEGLARHCLAALHGVVGGNDSASVCSSDDLGYVADQYRWLPLSVALRDADETTMTDDDIAIWERRMGEQIVGRTRAENRAAVLERLGTALSDQAARDAVTFGTRRPSVVESTIGREAFTAGWSQSVRDTLERFSLGGPVTTHLNPGESIEKE